MVEIPDKWIVPSTQQSKESIDHDFWEIYNYFKVKILVGFPRFLPTHDSK